jgi:thiamine biosynthesis lipoprotein ApbE
VLRSEALEASFGDASWTALGTGVRLLTTAPAALPAAREVLVAELAAIDLAASRFRGDSEVSRLAAAGGAAVPVSPILAGALAAALRAARLTGGAVDPTVGATIADLGYDRDHALVGADRPAVTVRRLPGWRSVDLDAAAGTVRVPPSTVIDLGATAKAYSADRAARAAAERTGCGVLVSLGGDVAVAGPAPAGGWRITVADHHSAVSGEAVTIRSGGLATSSTTARRWRRGGQDLHHLLDPATCAPARGPWRTVSVAAGSCLDANIGGTATIIMGARGRDWLAATGLAARLVAHDGGRTRLNGWPEADRCGT